MTRKRPCKLCGQDLSIYGPDYKGRPCPDCIDKLAKVKIKCAGRCNKRFPRVQMMRVVVNWNPGRRSEKTELIYCRECAAVASAKTTRIQNDQKQDMENAKERIRRESMSQQGR